MQKPLTIQLYILKTLLHYTKIIRLVNRLLLTILKKSINFKL
ncbi:hypothetical protein FPSE_11119 [Fusarium pseudograminearum CS3096]|uniref:Uncharacterized protein n=1 Tax=Fusarium pseudograminearum (strain CS3096) TaxID=1028729 RepID=K3V600_FUSPC|nr:hypothetical protein FPSE_11119 [Fusarium pseudograminearum CS3096]EKJ68702.1 hypothetical protein FPSE_11119 [Fusarium pseudograminearum CS3096]